MATKKSGKNVTRKPVRSAGSPSKPSDNADQYVAIDKKVAMIDDPSIPDSRGPSTKGRVAISGGRKVVSSHKNRGHKSLPSSGHARIHTGYDTERFAYGVARPGLLKTCPGRFVVFVGDEMLGPFDDFRSAHVTGRRRFGPGPLYIKQVLAEEPVFEPVGLEPCLS